MRKISFTGAVITILAVLMSATFAASPLINIPDSLQSQELIEVEIVTAEEEFVGIGATLSPPWKVTVTSDETTDELKREIEETNDTYAFIYISAIVCDGPAAQAGLKYGDIVIAIENTTLVGITQDEFREATRIITGGVENTPVTLTIGRGANAPFNIEVTRQKVSRNFSIDCE